MHIKDDIWVVPHYSFDCNSVVCLALQISTFMNTIKTVILKEQSVNVVDATLAPLFFPFNSLLQWKAVLFWQLGYWIIKDRDRKDPVDHSLHLHATAQLLPYCTLYSVLCGLVLKVLSTEASIDSLGRLSHYQEVFPEIHLCFTQNNSPFLVFTFFKYL